jgi:ribosomal protein S18 acetylase RimI-like enzyme
MSLVSTSGLCGPGVGKASPVIQYRPFRNGDPPGLVAVWNESLTGRGAARLAGTLLLEYFDLAKPYFDPAGLLVALDEGQIVGFAQSGFGPAADGTRLDPSRGILCLLAVRPKYQRQGIGSELLHRSEAYLRERGAQTLYAGALSPDNPFTFGLYGGSQSPGFLHSDLYIHPFLEHRGYRPENGCRILQRSLRQLINVADGRFAAHRQRYEIRLTPHHDTTWWQECVHGPAELHEYRMEERAGSLAAHAVVWEMETFDQRWNEHTIGLVDLEVQPELRRRGLARFLLTQILRHLQEQFFTLVEMQVAERDNATLQLLAGLGFTEVDSGRRYRREGGA